MPTPQPRWLISACLLGHTCRYDGATANDGARSAVLPLLDAPHVGFCPEEAGGLSTPRPPAQMRAGDGHAVLDGRNQVLTNDGADVTAAFVAGASAALDAAQAFGATHACLKARSPSCGVGRTYDKSGLIDGDGVAAALLRRAGLVVTSDEDLAQTRAAHTPDAEAQ